DEGAAILADLGNKSARAAVVPEGHYRSRFEAARCGGKIERAGLPGDIDVARGLCFHHGGRVRAASTQIGGEHDIAAWAELSHEDILDSHEVALHDAPRDGK